MFKIQGDEDHLLMRMYEDKFKDNSISIFIIKVTESPTIDKNEFTECVNKIKLITENTTKLSSVILLSRLLRTIEHNMIKQQSKILPSDFFPKFEKEEQDNRNKWYGSIEVSFDIFKKFTDGLTQLAL